MSVIYKRLNYTRYDDVVSVNVLILLCESISPALPVSSSVLAADPTSVFNLQTDWMSRVTFQMSPSRWGQFIHAWN